VNCELRLELTLWPRIPIVIAVSKLNAPFVNPETDGITIFEMRNRKRTDPIRERPLGHSPPLCILQNKTVCTLKI
jgi:hypothetical protein